MMTKEFILTQQRLQPYRMYVSKPNCVIDLRRFLGMTNQMSKLPPSLADITKP